MRKLLLILILSLPLFAATGDITAISIKYTRSY